MRKCLSFYGLLAVCLASTLACHNSDDYSPTAPQFQDSLTLMASADVVIADGTSTVDIIAKIDPRAEAGRRTVVLKTTAGTLVTSDSEGTGVTTGSMVKIAADAAGEAKAKLRSAAAAGTTAEITAQVEGVEGLIKRVYVTFVAPENGLILTASPTSLPADGFSLADLTARVELGDTPTARQVVFVTSIGSLVGAGTVADDGRQITVDVDSDGVALAQLKSNRTVGSAFIRAHVEGLIQIADELTIAFTPVVPDQILQLSSSRTTADADGASRIQIFANISPSLPTGERQVTFKSELGTFTNGMKDDMATADASNRATVTLVAPRIVGLDRVRAEVAGVTDDVTIDFVRALPDRILVDPGGTQLMAGFEFNSTVTATLVRVNSPGDVTEKTAVAFKVVDPATGSELPFTFTGVTLSNADGVATAVLTAGPSAFRGPARIEASVEGTAVVGSAVIQIVDPPPM